MRYLILMLLIEQSLALLSAALKKANLVYSCSVPRALRALGIYCLDTVTS
jgi:hypothetical protein